MSAEPQQGNFHPRAEREPSGPDRAGIAYLVGAGPGDPGLMTRRSLELIASADVILYDRLIPAGALGSARSDAELIYVGKGPKGSTHQQKRTTELLVEHVRAGRRVVRLKGGDPLVFGRGGEEAEALAAAGLAFEIVPGVTAGVAAPGYAGIPVTHRDDASAVAFITGHEDPVKEADSGSALDFTALAAFPGTLVFYMGVTRLAELADALVAAGRDPGEPAAVIERGTMPGQRVVSAPLAELPAAAADAEVRPPALIVIGAVTARREELAWFERRPLHGRTIVITRARAQASGLAARLQGLGAEVIELPAIRIVSRTGEPEVGRALEAIDGFDLVCLTSPNGVHLLFEALGTNGRDARALSHATVAAIGPGTAAALRERGIEADVVPERSVAESLLDALDQIGVEGKRVLVARAAEARDVLPDGLRERGADVEVVALYETVAEEVDQDVLVRLSEADYITFTSSSTVRNFVAATGGHLRPEARIVSIGPITSETARELGLRVDVEATDHDIEGLVSALLADAATPTADGGRGG